MCSFLESQCTFVFFLSKCSQARGSCGVGPSGFQTKGFEDRGVGSASLFSPGLALCHVLCSAGIFTSCLGRISPRWLSCSVVLFRGIGLLDHSFSARYFENGYGDSEISSLFKRAGIM